MSDRAELDTVLAKLSRTDIPEAITLLFARLVAALTETTNGHANAADREAGAGAWMAAAELRREYHWSDRTIRRRIHHGTWRKGVHYVKKGSSPILYSRPAIEAWLREESEPPSTPGLAFSGDIPPGRRRRQTIAGMS